MSSLISTGSKKITDIADAVLDPIIAVITLTAFAIILPIIVNVFKGVQAAQQGVAQIQQTLSNQQLPGGASGSVPGSVYAQASGGPIIGYWTWDPTAKKWTMTRTR